MVRSFPAAILTAQLFWCTGTFHSQFVQYESNVRVFPSSVFFLLNLLQAGLEVGVEGEIFGRNEGSNHFLMEQGVGDVTAEHGLCEKSTYIRVKCQRSDLNNIYISVCVERKLVHQHVR